MVGMKKSTALGLIKSAKKQNSLVYISAKTRIRAKKARFGIIRVANGGYQVYAKRI